MACLKKDRLTYEKSLVQLLGKGNLLRLPDAELDQVVNVLESGVERVLGDGLVRLGSEAGEERIGAKGAAREFHGCRHYRAVLAELMWTVQASGVSYVRG